MKKSIIVASLCALALLSPFASPATAQSAAVISFDQALIDGAANIAAKVVDRPEIIIVGIGAPSLDIANLIADELDAKLSETGKFKIMERGHDLNKLLAEKGFQMSDLVDINTAVGIGHYIGAKVVVTGEFKHLSGFNHFVLRAIDVKTAQRLTTYTARTRPDRLTGGE